MTCLSDGILRAKLDGELSEVESLEVQNHLTACADCRRRAEAIAAEAERVRAALSALDPLPSEAPGEARTAFARFRAEHAEPPAQAPSFAGRLFARRLRPVWGAVAALAAVAVFLSFAPARGWGQKILAMLRVQKIAVVTIDPEVLSSGREGDDKGRSIGRLMSDNLVVTMDPGKPQHVSSVDEASQLAGFRVRALTGLSDQPQLSVEGEGAFHMTLNRDRLQAILDEAGRPDLQLPEALDDRRPCSEGGLRSLWQLRRAEVGPTGSGRTRRRSGAGLGPEGTRGSGLHVPGAGSQPHGERSARSQYRPGC